MSACTPVARGPICSSAFAGSMPFVYLHAAVADHDFVAHEFELKTNTELTRAIHHDHGAAPAPTGECSGPECLGQPHPVEVTRAGLIESDGTSKLFGRPGGSAVTSHRRRQCPRAGAPVPCTDFRRKALGRCTTGSEGCGAASTLWHLGGNLFSSPTAAATSVPASHPLLGTAK
jgi:hypothetical protein